MRASGPRSQGCSAPAVDLMATATTAWRPRRAVDRSGPRAAGPLPRRQARAPGDAGQRPALPRVFRPGRRPHGHCDDAMETAPSGRLFRTAGRWPASAPPGAAPGDAGQRPALPSVFRPGRRPHGHCDDAMETAPSGRLFRTAGRWPASAPPGAAPGDAGQRPAPPRVFRPRRRPHGHCDDGMETAPSGRLFRTAGRWPASAPPGAGSRGCGPAARAPRGVPPRPSTSWPLRRRHGDRAERSIVPDRGPLARFRAARRGLPGMRASGPRSQGCSAPAVDLMATATTPWRPRRAVDCSGPRAAGPLPRRQARAPGDAGQRPALPGVFRPGRRPHGHCDDGMETAPSGRLFRTAGRWPASAPPGAGSRGCGPAARAPKGVPPRPSTSWPRRHGDRAIVPDRVPLARLTTAWRPRRAVDCSGPRAAGPLPRRQARPPGMRASGPRSQGCSAPAVDLMATATTAWRPRRAVDRSGPRAAGPLPRRQARPPGMRASGPRSQGCSAPAVDLMATATTAWRPRRAVDCSGPRAAGPLPRRQARAPGDAGQRPALPGVFRPGRRPHGHCDDGMESASSGRLFRTAGRWPASAPPGAGSRGCGPAARAPKRVPPRPSTSWPLRRRHGDRAERSIVPDRGPLARFRAARRGLPGMRASGPRSQACSAPAVDLMATATTAWTPRRAVDCSGPRAAGPLPRRQARAPGDAGQRPALPGLYPVSSDAGRTVGCSVGAPTPPTSDTRTWRRLGSVEHQSTPSTAGSRSNAMPYLSNTSSRIRTAKSKTCVPVAPPWLTSTSGCRGHT